MTTVAQAAKEVRKVLKAKFPTVKFSVTSESFSMGDAVRVEYYDGPTRAAVEAEVNHFQYGSFDGMTDTYNYTNKIAGLPQTKYLTVKRNPSEATKAALVAELKGVHTDLGGYDDFFAPMGEYVYTLVHRLFCTRTY